MPLFYPKSQALPTCSQNPADRVESGALNPLRISADIFNVTTGICPPVEANLEVSNVGVTDVVEHCCGECRSLPSGAIQHVPVVKLELLPVVRAVRVEPEFKHPSGAGDRTWNGTFFEAFTEVTNVDDGARSCGDFGLKLFNREFFDSSLGCTDKVVHRCSHEFDGNSREIGSTKCKRVL